MADTWLLSGVPRSGSSLCARLAGRLPNTVALSEPMTADRFADTTDAATASNRVVAFVAEARRRIVLEGRAPSVHMDGEITDQMVAADAATALRAPRTSRGLIHVPPVNANFTLVVKHNALFAALLPWLRERLPCLGLVRNPVAVLASWETVALPVHDGRIPAGERFDATLRGNLERQPDVLRRRVTVLNWFFERFHRLLPAERIIRYEDLTRSNGAALRRALPGKGVGAVETLANRNAQALCGRDHVERALDGLLAASGPWRRFYDESECRSTAQAIVETAGSDSER